MKLLRALTIALAIWTFYSGFIIFDMQREIVDSGHEIIRLQTEINDYFNPMYVPLIEDIKRPKFGLKTKECK